MKAKRARADIPVPGVPLAQILKRSAQSRKSSKVRLLALSCAMSIAMIGTAAAFGTTIFAGVRVWLTGNTGSIVIHSFAFTRDPRAADIRHVVATATFPVVLPVGLPAGVHVQRVIYAPSDHPNLLSIQYQSNRSNWHADFTIVDTAAINAGQPPLPGMPVNTDRWSIGRETVLVPRGPLSPQMSRIKQAMLASSTPDSVRETTPLLYRATVLGAARDLGRIARQFTPATGTTVVLGSFFADAVPSLARRGQPLIGSNTTYATNIPSVQGRPDYARATLRWPRTIALSARGVHAAAAALRSSRAAAHCTCMLVVNTSDGLHYRVWDIQAGGAVKSYRIAE